MRKFIELPHHSFKIDKKEFETSTYLTNLTWLHDKINSTGCVQLLLDIYLISPPKSQRASEPQSPVTSKLSEHLDFLLKFLQIHFKSLNYDAQQIYSLLSTHIKRESAKRCEVAGDSIIQRWLKDIDVQKILRIEKIETGDDEEESESEAVDSNTNGYDLLINTNRDETFVISLSTEREEICVWNVLK